MSEVLRFACPGCHAQLAADHGYAAQTALCPDCGLPLILPGGKAPAGRKAPKLKLAPSPSMLPSPLQPSIPPSPDPVPVDEVPASKVDPHEEAEDPAAPVTVPDTKPQAEETAPAFQSVSSPATATPPPSTEKAGKPEPAGSPETAIAGPAAGAAAKAPLPADAATSGSSSPAASATATSPAKGSPAGKIAALLAILAAAAGGGVYANRDTLFPPASATAKNPAAPAATAKNGPPAAKPAASPNEGQRESRKAEPASPRELASSKSTSPDANQTAATAAARVNTPPAPPILTPAGPAAETASPAPSPSGTSAAAPPPPASAPVPKTPLGRARLVLESFLAAPDWRKRLEFALNPDSIRELVAAHFKDHPDGPIPVEGISLLTNDTVPGTTRRLFGFRVRIKDFHADVPMAVEETENGFRVDWPPFQETYEQRLRKFLEKPGSEPGDFRVVLRRKHYFGPSVPGQDTVRQAFSVESPMRDESWVVWIDLKSPVYTTKLVPQGATDWDTESFMIVHLEWQGDDKQGRWPALTGIIADSWQLR